MLLREAETEAFTARVNYTFKDPSLLRLALTHASARSRSDASDNERLEFLGDRVLGLAVADLLLTRFASAPEGELARRYNRLVRAETCAAIAREWGLGALMVMSGAEAESGGRTKKTILSDACEAVLGAIFIDGGYAVAAALVELWWTPHLGELIVPHDAKSALQEWAQSRRLPLPLYVSISRTGPDHAPKFTTEVRVEGLIPFRGEGASKREAEQAAAHAMLLREGVWDAGHAER